MNINVKTDGKQITKLKFKFETDVKTDIES